jgi:hypothetical protein
VRLGLESDPVVRIAALTWQGLDLDKQAWLLERF